MHVFLNPLMKKEEHKNSVIGKQFLEKHNVKRMNLNTNFKVLKKCQGKLECLILEILYHQHETIKPSRRNVVLLGGVYMTPGRLSPRSKFTPFPSHGFIFVYMIPPQISCWRESPRREFTPVLVPGREFHSCTKSRNGIM